MHRRKSAERPAQRPTPISWQESAAREAAAAEKAAAAARRASHQLLTAAAAAVTVFTVAAATFANSLTSPLLHDDLRAISENSDVTSVISLRSLLSLRSLDPLLRHDSFGNPMSSPTRDGAYQPIAVLSFALNHAIHGLSPYGYHLTNVLLHATASALLSIFASLLLPPPAAFFGSLLFAVLPINSAAVASASGRAEVLAGLWTQLSLISYLAATNAERNGRGLLHATLVGMALCAGALGAGSSETASSVFILLGAVELGVRARHGGTRHRAPLAAIRLTLATACAIALVVWRRHVCGGVPPNIPAALNPAAAHPELAVRARTLGYLAARQLLLIPSLAGFACDYSGLSVPLVLEGDTRVYIAVSVLLPVLAVGVRLGWAVCSEAFGGKGSRGAREKHPSMRAAAPTRYLSKAGAAFIAYALLVLPWLPSSHLLGSLLGHVGFVISERALYMPSMGASLLAALTIHRAIGAQKAQRCSAAAALLLISVYAWRATECNLLWRSSESLYRSTLAHLPENAQIHLALGRALANEGGGGAETREATPEAPAFHEALMLYERSVELDRRAGFAVKADTLYSIGVARMHLGQFESAEETLRQAMAAAPDPAWAVRFGDPKALTIATEVRYNLGVVLIRKVLNLPQSPPVSPNLPQSPPSRKESKPKPESDLNRIQRAHMLASRV